MDGACICGKTRIVASGECGNGLTWVLNDEGVLTISGSGAMTNYDLYPSRAPWDSYSSSVTSITIEEGVTSIGDWAFWWCENLTSVTIPNSITSIGDWAFGDCRSLTSVTTIPDSVTSIGTNAFSNCTSLTELVVDEKNAYYCSEDGVLFNKAKTMLLCYPGGKVGAYTIPDSVTSIGDSAFYNCISLTSVTIPDSVTSIDNWAFANCSSLTDVTIPDSVTSIGDYAFDACRGLTSVTIGNSVTSIGNYAFDACRGLTSVNIPDSVTSIGDCAFHDCTSLKSISLPESVTTIGEHAFGFYTDLETFNDVIVDSFTAIVTMDSAAETYCITNGINYKYDIDNTFVASGNCGSTGNNVTWTLSSNGVLTISGSGNMTDYAKASETPWYSYHSSITGIVIKRGITRIGSHAFQTCSECYVTMADSVTTIGEYAFASNWSLIQVSFSGGLRTIEKNAFNADRALERVELPRSVTTIGDNAFQLCDSISYVFIPQAVTSVGRNVFSSCPELTTVGPEGSGCKIEFGWTTSIPDNAFNGDKDLIAVYMPDTIKTIGKHAFEFCTELQYIYLSNTLTTIGNYCFVDDTALQTIYIPSSVKSIAQYATDGSGIKDVYYQGSSSGWSGISISSFNDPLKNASKHYGHTHSPSSNSMSTCKQTVTTCACGAVWSTQSNEMHSWGSDKVIKPATTTAYGLYYHTCKVCKTTEYQALRYHNPFSDIGEGKDFYYIPVLWAVDLGITAGITKTTFEPNSTCTRGQVVTFLWRAAGKPEPKSNNNPFTDVIAGKYYYKAVLWAVENGITSGMTKTTFEPNSPCTRGQVVTFQWRAAGKPEPKSTNNPFTDVKDGKFYSKAVLWAVENGITSGMTKTTFVPDNVCTRGQIVTFLYRQYS